MDSLKSGRMYGHSSDMRVRGGQVCVLLAGSHAGSTLDNDLVASDSAVSRGGLPLALLPSGIDGESVLDVWWATVNRRDSFSKVYLVTNADKYKHFERWATANDFPTENIVNDGTTSAVQGLGELGMLRLVLRSKQIDSDLCVLSCESMFYPESFDMQGVLKFFHHKGGELVTLYTPRPDEDISAVPELDVDAVTARVMGYRSGAVPSVHKDPGC